MKEKRKQNRASYSHKMLALTIMNIEIRKKILKISLLIENALSDVLMEIMGIRDKDNKTLGHKASALSFKAKTDLLFDIDKINKELYDNLIMFMEIRNQFIHNLSSDSFEIVLERVKKRNHILKLDKRLSDFINSATDSDKKEEVYNQAFSLLSIEILEKLDALRTKILNDKIEELESKKKAIQRDAYTEILEILANAIDEFSELYNENMQKHFGNDRNYGETIRYGIRACFEKKMNDKKNES